MWSWTWSQAESYHVLEWFPTDRKEKARLSGLVDQIFPAFRILSAAEKILRAD